MNHVTDIKPKKSSYSIVKSTFGEITAIFFLFAININLTKFALGIDGDDTYTSYKDESLDDHLSPFYKYLDSLDGMYDFFGNIFGGALIVWVVLSGVDKLLKNTSGKDYNGETFLEKCHLKLFKIRSGVALFTIVYFIIALIFYFSYTAQFFN